jgi:type II secretory pathway component PulF
VPALTIFLGLIVGTLIASMLTAILSVNDLAVQ